MRMPHLSKKFWIVFFTVGAVAVLFAYYLLIYVKDRRSDLIAKNFRILARIGWSIEELKVNHEKTVENNRSNLDEKKAEVYKFKRQLDYLEHRIFRQEEWVKSIKGMESRLNESKKVSNEPTQQKALATNDPAYQSKVIDDWKRRLEAYKSETDKLLANVKTMSTEVSKTLAQLGPDIADSSVNLSKQKLFVSDKMDGGQVDELDSIYFSYDGVQSSQEKEMVQPVESGTIRARIESSLNIKYRDLNLKVNRFMAISVSDFLEKVPMDSDDPFFVIRAKRIKYNEVSPEGPPQSEDTKPKKDDRVTKIVYQKNLMGHLNIGSIDSLYEEDYGIRTIPVREVQISGVEYKVFTQIVPFSADEEWILCRATVLSQFESEARRIDTYKIVFAILVGLFILLAMPILKLVIMSEIERLRIINVWFTGFSIVVGTAVLLVIIIGVIQHYGHTRKIVRNLTKLSGSIEENFGKELDSIKAELDELRCNDALMINLHEEMNHLYSLARDTDSIRFPFKNPVTDNKDTTTIEVGKFYRNFNQILLLRENGNLVTTFLSDKVNSSIVATPFNLSNRSYFSKAKDESLWYLHDDTNGFAMQSIRSWSDGTLEVGIGMPIKRSKENSVIAMAMTLPSVINTVLPAGYGFAIIDEEGHVWFHSSSEKTMQENFLAETEYDSKIMAAVKGRIGASIRSNYSGKSYEIFIQPLDKLPLHIVTFYDLEYKVTPLILTVGVAFMFLIAMFMILGFQLFLQYLSVYRYSRLKIKRFYLSWLRPRRFFPNPKAPQNILNVETYLRSIAVLLVFVILHTILAWRQPTPYWAACFIISPVYVFLFQYLIFERRNILAFQSGYKYKTVFIHPFFVLSVLLLILLNAGMAVYIKEFVYAVLLQMIYIVVFILAYGRSDMFRRLSNYIGFLKRPMLLYFSVIFLWLISTSVLSVWYFYKTSHCAEYATWAKFESWQTAIADYERDKKLQGNESLYENYSEIKKRGNYLSTLSGFQSIEDSKFKICDSLIKAGEPCFKSQSVSSLDSVEFLTIPSFGGLIAATRSMLQSASHDKKWLWYNNAKNDTVGFSFKPEPGKGYHYSYSRVKSDFLQNEYIVLMIVCLISLAWVIFRVTLFAVRNIFGLGIVMDSGFKRESKRKINEADLILGKGERGYFFIVGLPHSGKDNLISRFIATQKLTKPNVKEIELRNEIPDLQKPGQLSYLSAFDIIIVRHFEHGINEPAINDAKLKLFTALAGLTHATVIVISTIQSSSVIDFYERSIQRLPGVSSEEAKKERSEYKQAIRKWKNALSNYITYYQPLEFNGTMNLPDHFIQSEIRYGNYLPTLEPQLRGLGVLSPTREEYENIILRVEELADTYYHSLWNSFTNDEKMLLFDLAKDRFVNLRNTKAIRILMQKGVIKAEESLQVMNRSFNNFILSTVNQDDEIRMQKEQDQKGTWSTVYAVLIILFIGLFSFVTLAQQKLLQDFGMLIGVLSSAIALIARFGGLFGSSSNKTQ